MRVEWLLVAAIAVVVRAGEVCYPRLGCFSDAHPYSHTLQRPISRSPWPPEIINTRFLLFTRETPGYFESANEDAAAWLPCMEIKPLERSNVLQEFGSPCSDSEQGIRQCRFGPDLPNLVLSDLGDPDPLISNIEAISALEVSSISATKFNPRRKSRFIIHGFREAGEKPWLVEMCQNLLQVSDVNCFSVDWVGGAIALYTQAANNVRVVGAEVAYFIQYLLDQFNYPLSDIYLIGHSLGAHVAGEAGKRRPGIARISGLDPAGPYFENTPLEVRLDPSDAVLVDIIHTNGLPDFVNLGLKGFGMSQLVGHLDFFPNGGQHMPGCPYSFLKLGDMDTVIKGIEEQILCDHQRSVAFFSQSILHPEGFVGYPGPSYSSFQEGAGFPCSKGSCAMMGYYADSYTPDANFYTQDPTSQTFFLNTGDLANLLHWRYQVTIKITGSMLGIASFKVSLCGTMGCSPRYIIHSGFIISGKSYSSFIDVEMDVQPVTKAVFIWHKEALSIFSVTLGATSMTVQYGPTGTIYHLCGNAVTTEDIQQTLESCPMYPI